MQSEVVTLLRTGADDRQLNTLAPAQQADVAVSVDAGQEALTQVLRLFLSPDEDVTAFDRFEVGGVLYSVAGQPDRRAGMALVVVVARWVPDSLVIIGAAGAPAWNAERRQTETAVAAPVYGGQGGAPATVGPAGPDAGRLVEAVEQMKQQRVYAVALPRGVVGVARGQVVRVVSNPDPALAGALLRVASVERGGRVGCVVLATLDG